MSQLAFRTVSATSGNNARALQGADPHREAGSPLRGTAPKAAKPRTPLSLVVSVPRRNRTPLVISLFLLVVAALSAVLVMSVSVSQGQYELVALKTQQSNLEKSNQAMELDLTAREAPQSLVAKAAAMGMVPAATTGQIDVRTKKVTGNPQPASADTKGLVVIPPANMNAPQPAASSGPAAVPDAALQDAASKDAAASGTDAPKAVLGAAPAAAAPDLNGGTIPAPGQKHS
jgi:hypothetical protein